MSSFGFGEEDDEDGVLDTQFSFPEEGKCLTQVSEMEESQVMAAVESESFRSASTTQLLKRVRRSDSDSPPRDLPNKYRKVDFFPNRPEPHETEESPPAEKGDVNEQVVPLAQNVSVDVTPQKRRIPGPAGNVSFDGPETPKAPQSGNRIRHPLYRHLQGQSGRHSSAGCDNDVFYKAPWLKLLSTWELPPFHDSDSVELLDYSIKYVVLFGYHKRVPQLFVIIKDVNSTDVETTVTFRDPTGEMQGTVHKSVTEKWGADIRIGSVLCLKTVTVFNPTPFAHYLNVTSETVVDVIPPDCKPPSMDNTIQEKLRKMNPACIYKRRSELETNDPRTLHRLAQQQMRTLQQRREASLQNGCLSFHAAPTSSPKPDPPRGAMRGGARGGARGGSRGGRGSRGRGRGGANLPPTPSPSRDAPVRQSFAAPDQTPTRQNGRLKTPATPPSKSGAPRRLPPQQSRTILNPSSPKPPSGPPLPSKVPSNQTQSTLFQASQRIPPTNSSLPNQNNSRPSPLLQSRLTSTTSFSTQTSSPALDRHPSRSPVLTPPPPPSPTPSPSPSPSSSSSPSPLFTSPVSAPSPPSIPSLAPANPQPQQNAAFGFGFEDDEDEMDSIFAGIDDNLIQMWSQQSPKG